MRRLSITAAVFLLLAGTIAVVRSGLNLVPLRFLWRYGPAPACAPTGEVIPLEGVEFVVIGPGCFRMGSDARGRPGDAPGRLCPPVGIGWGTPPVPSDEMPVHWVEFRHGFAVARTEVTNAGFERFARDHERDPRSPGDRHPVVNVSWQGARRYARWLSERTGRVVRLPSEAEWEAARRAGSEARDAGVDGVGATLGLAWCSENSRDRAHPVGTKTANAWGLFDLSGNVWEWCEDAGHESYHLRAGAPRDHWRAKLTADATAPDDGSAWRDEREAARIFRGGAWSLPADYCRPALRYWNGPSYRARDLGFRLALTLPER